MTSTTAPPPGPDGLVHRAVPYRDPEHQAVAIAGPVTEALETGRRALVIVDPRCAAVLRHSLGHDAGVEFRSPDRMHSAPPFTVAGRWSRAVREALADGASGVCTVGQPVELPHADPAYWTRLDLALSHALRALPVELLCCFPDAEADRARAGALHDEFLVDGVPVPSDCRRDDHELLAENPQRPPDELGPPIMTLPVTLDDLGSMRRIVERQAELSGLGPTRVSDLVLAVNELISNGVEHGSGHPVLRMWRTEAGLVSEMSDAATCRLAFPGLAAPPVSGERGRGMWLASELSDVLQVWTAEDDPGQVTGTVVRVTMSPP
ncbi:putative regulator of sigma factor [Pseudonocardia sp. Ae406_Ps2]|uniref:ATP-binding protein n=1 Tax=unclassified Pseudonocardia TaxID=2619320 RepID=UPI00094AAC15|nr:MULTISPECIES: ATP-binding protein [unclassified Pseudonocardia]OLL98114.1 putative regulator of sigma factor [Pseudonocardia sp. Ae331_Ps2]OLM04178.1 putative regulator of sigma factor [Pseudonocardia sp. Ae406_Ps2]OLM10994.1 putative regulator of sigma factor [Pseudonocardia sp. Ae505_Ps2]OLM25729.1 putative regulator of sigma factor [Pseudonocardia sp. Ae706_Ps2]OLM34122.1 putative regulator of sigma factor [Pseudonocardia sp. Ae717_Ps2]